MARFYNARSALALLALLSVGCAPDFDKISELQTLRILAVQKDKPYAVPGETVTLSMLWRDSHRNADGSSAPPRPVQVAWMTGCENPPGDLFFSCFAPKVLFTGLEAEQCPLGAMLPEGLTVCDNKVVVPISSAIADRPRTTDPTQPAYGLDYVFFAACAGTLKLLTEPPQNERDFPFGCFDESGTRLGSDDFVAGYTSIYVYKPELGITNSNPPLSSFIFDDQPVAQRCLGDECLTIPESWTDGTKLRCPGESDAADAGSDAASAADAGPVDAGAGDAGPDDAGPGDAGPGDASSGARLEVPCVAPCEDDGDESCPGHKFRPELLLPPEGLAKYAEPDVLSRDTRGRDITEQMWIDYYVERGGVKSEVRLLNDAFTGPNPDFGSEFWAPKAEGPSILWAVVHDNRGGMSWVGMPILIRTPPVPNP